MRTRLRRGDSNWVYAAALPGPKVFGDQSTFVVVVVCDPLLVVPRVVVVVAPMPQVVICISRRKCVRLLVCRFDWEKACVSCSTPVLSSSGRACGAIDCLHPRRLLLPRYLLLLIKPRNCKVPPAAAITCDPRGITKGEEPADLHLLVF
ncbi:hypothetical protein O3P69_008398 [Scylla paramamosain]|uniref:Uncharacterized protein n=1 Tax=Scylla paramamosain TaxID=85552 RepID=A0AAW0SN62_SCYPA